MAKKKKKTHQQIGRMSKNKGRDGEQELVHFMRWYGLDAERTSQFCGKTGEASDVRVKNCEMLHVESKRTECLQLYAALRQATEESKVDQLPVVFHRRNKFPWVAIVEARHFIQLLKDAGYYVPDNEVAKKERDYREQIELFGVASKREKKRDKAVKEGKMEYLRALTEEDVLDR